MYVETIFTNIHCIARRDPITRRTPPDSHNDSYLASQQAGGIKAEHNFILFNVGYRQFQTLAHLSYSPTINIMQQYYRYIII